jgi:hypothetical protein
MTDKLELGPGKICCAPVRVIKTFDDGSIAVEPAHQATKRRTLDRRNPKPPLFVTVITAGADPDAPPEQERQINFNRPLSREWLIDHMAWALNTGRTVHLAAVS